MNKRKCRKCGEEKPLIEMSKHKKGKDGYDTICKECSVRHVNEWKDENYEKFISYQKKYNIERADEKRIDTQNRRNVIRSFIHKYKSDKRCLICGYNKNTNILVFHHRDPLSKEFGIAKRNSTNMETLKEEISKCDLLCVNCHRELHWKETQENLKEDVSETTIKKRRYQKWFNEMKEKNGCSVCGEKRPYVLDYHHIGEREQWIHQMVQKRVVKKKLLIEIEKCDLLCANCHQELHD